MKRLLSIVVFLLGMSNFAFSQTTSTPVAESWQFSFSGDSRNCGDIVMPTIAKDIATTKAEFYWHLGDIRAVYDFDEDIKLRPGKKQPTILDYENKAWQDFIEQQINAFKVPFYLGIGNHEAISPKSRNDFMIQFADWLNSPVLREQRLKDDPDDHKLRTYFHWRRGGIDFIYLDNATSDQFDSAQMKWFNKVMDRAAADPTITTIVVGMHEALPDSLSIKHSMSDYPAGVESGRKVYQRLLKARDKEHKLVYVLASHSHFLMEGIFNSDYWKQNGGVLPSWIVGTAGAHRYKLPEDAEKNSPLARTNVYGYMLATVNPSGQPAGSIRFDFREMKETDVSPEIQNKFGPELVHWCFEKNSETAESAPIAGN